MRGDRPNPLRPSERGVLITTIISAVADAEDALAKTIKNPPLYDVIDAVALEDALVGSEKGARTDDSSTEFMYYGYRIVVQTDSWVLVHESAET